jgi:hypothetical protein
MDSLLVGDDLDMGVSMSITQPALLPEWAPVIVPARAVASPPCGRRYRWLVIVSRCPHCGTLHQHYVAEVARLLSGRVERRCPVRHAVYALTPVTRRAPGRRAAPTGPRGRCRLPSVRVAAGVDRPECGIL